MFPYSLIQILFFFYVYCFVGWIIESTWVSAHEKKFVNRGFMRGPFIPIYGFGALALLLSSAPALSWQVNPVVKWIAVFFIGMIAASVLEYYTGVAMEAIFKVRYWDYSKKKFNINGHVCLFNSICWGLLSLGMNFFVHKPINEVSVSLGDRVLGYITGVISVYFIVDLTLAFKAAFDLRDLIIGLEKAKEELRIMQKRLDVMLAYANQDATEQIDKVQDKISAKFEDLSTSVEEKMRTIKVAMEEKPQVFAENVRTEYYELMARFTVKKDEHFGLNKFNDFYKRGIFLGNPTLASTKFKDSVEAIKNFVTEKKQK